MRSAASSSGLHGNLLALVLLAVAGAWAIDTVTAWGGGHSRLTVSCRFRYRISWSAALVLATSVVSLAFSGQRAAGPHSWHGHAGHGAAQPHHGDDGDDLWLGVVQAASLTKTPNQLGGGLAALDDPVTVKARRTSSYCSRSVAGVGPAPHRRRSRA